MRNVVVLLGSLILATACGRDDARPAGPSTPSPIPSPSPAPEPTPPSPSVHVISAGEEVKGELTQHGTHKLYQLTAQSDGELIAQVSWDTKQGALELWLDDAQFFTSVSPTVGRLRVTAGGTYRLKVADARPWDYDDLSLSFVLTTAVE
jgi:hypothetical protein